jgi:hypothetical protein
MRRTASLNALFIALSVLSSAFLFFSISGADSRTIVVGGSASMSAHVRLVDTFTFNGLDSTRFGGQPKVTYNAPVFASDSVSGFSQTISGFGIAVSPTPTLASGPLTDNFGNLYYHYEWSLSGYTQDSFTFVVTTDFDRVTTGSPTPESFSDPYPVPPSGQGRFLASTSMAQADDPRIVGQARSSFVVLDTAPTGHTLLLLDATGSYHRQILATESGSKRPAARLTHVVTPLMRLRDPEYTKVLLVTLAETTPVSEAARLQDDLRRAQIEPYAWIINSSLAAAGSGDPCLKQRIAGELAQIEIVRAQHAQRIAIVPWMTEEPVGPQRLLALARRGDADSREGATEQAQSLEG